MIQEKLVRTLGFPVVGIVAFGLLKILGIEIPRSVVIGKNLVLAHGAVGLVVHERTKIGDNVRLYQGVTIGRSDVYRSDSASAVSGVRIGNDVIVGANAVILFRSGTTVRIGDGAVIGAGSVVSTDVPSGEIWAGAPARRVGTVERLDSP